MHIQETRNRRVRYQPVGAFNQAMSLVRETQILYRNIALLKRRYDLFCLTYRNTRIIGTMYDKEGGRDAVYGTYWRNLLQEFAVMLKATIFRLAILAPPRPRILQERHEVGDTHNVHARRPDFGIRRHRRQYHKAAIAAAHYRYPLWVSNAALTQPHSRVLQVAYRVHAQSHIVQ